MVLHRQVVLKQDTCRLSINQVHRRAEEGLSRAAHTFLQHETAVRQPEPVHIAQLDVPEQADAMMVDEF